MPFAGRYFLLCNVTQNKRHYALGAKAPMEDFYRAVVVSLDPHTLRDWLLEGRVPVIVDVRDSDYRYGHIINSVHCPSKSFSGDAIEQLLHQHPLSSNTVYVFHCMRSQIRGPRCARKFVRHLFLNTEVKDDYGKCPRVYILTGGLKKWNELYGDDPRLMVAM